MEKLVELYIEIGTMGMKVVRHDLTIVKETPKMLMVSGNWRSRMDKSQLGVRVKRKSFGFISYEGIIPAEEEAETMERLKNHCDLDIQEMKDSLSLLTKQVKEWKKGG